MSVAAGMLSRVAAPQTPYGRTTLVSGPETLLADRAVADLLVRARREDVGVEVSQVDAARLDPGRLAAMTGASLFSVRRVAVVTDLANLAAELAPPLLEVTRAALPDLALVLVHGGGQKGKGLLDKLKAGGAQVVDCPSLKLWELPQFVAAEVRRVRGTIDAGASQALVDAVGSDLRALAAAAAQLVADTEGEVTAEDVRRYFGGRAEVTSFAVTDAVLSGRTGVAMEQLRWALTTGVAPVLVTSALAAGVRGLGRLLGAAPGLRETDLAREVGVPPWKLRSMRSQARGWDAAGLAAALKAMAKADAEVKGAADDAGFALERAVLQVAAARRS